MMTEIQKRFKVVKEIDIDRKAEKSAKQLLSSQGGENDSEPTDPAVDAEDDEILEFSQMEQHVLIDPETATAKEVCHIIVCQKMMTKFLPLFQKDYDELMEEFRKTLGASDLKNSWGAVLPAQFRKPDSLKNDLSKISTPSMPHIFQEFGQGIAIAFDSLARQCGQQFPDFNFSTLVGNPTRMVRNPTTPSTSSSFLHSNLGSGSSVSGQEAASFSEIMSQQLADTTPLPITPIPQSQTQTRWLYIKIYQC